MRQTAGKLFVMIIGMGLALGASPSLFAAPNLPADPVHFLNAMELGDVAQAEAWLDAGMDPEYQGSRTGTGLMIGAWEGRLDLMKVFLAHGADINHLNANGESALALAAWRGNLEAVKWLLERGARINAPAKRWSALHYAVFAGHKEVAEYLVAQGADVNAQTTNGSTPLMLSAYEGHTELAKLLLEKGADRAVRNDWGDGVLEWSMRQNRLELARMVTNPEEFNIAVAKPRETWGEPMRSLRTSKELETLLAMRDKLRERGMSVEAVDKRIAAERVRIMRAEVDQNTPPRAAALQITASRAKPEQQSATVIYDDKGKPVGYKAPPATYFGTPKMPAKMPVKNY